jgi:hypothetical protein
MEKELLSKIRSFILGLILFTLLLKTGATRVSSNIDKRHPITSLLPNSIEESIKKPMKSMNSSYLPSQQISQLPVQMWNFTIPSELGGVAATWGMGIADVNDDG